MNFYAGDVMKMKAVLFDVDGVLLDSFLANWTWYQRLFATLEYPAPNKKEYKHMAHLSMWDVIKTVTKASDEDVRRMWEFAKTTPSTDELLQTPPHAAEIIHTLKKNYRLGIVTSRIRENIDPVFQLLGVHDCFASVVGYEDSINHKPHPEPLLVAAERLGVRPHDTVYVGDALSDIQAAKAAGMPIIIYGPQPLPGADACITLFNQLPDAIARLNAKA